MKHILLWYPTDKRRSLDRYSSDGIYSVVKNSFDHGVKTRCYKLAEPTALGYPEIVSGSLRHRFLSDKRSI